MELVHGLKKNKRRRCESKQAEVKWPNQMDSSITMVLFELFLVGNEEWESQDPVLTFITETKIIIGMTGFTSLLGLL